ncbi:MAG TPA: hypothetical protein VLR89_09510 [Anaerolineaceae bacterium]|nr:hypothetical protein [Anaerolineaceae bacterium]
MSPLKTVESGTTLRNRLNRSIVLAIRTLMQQSAPNQLSLDLAAFIVLALEKIQESVESSALAWEKRDYWLKADRFRMESQWVGEARKNLTQHLLQENWPLLAADLTSVAQNLNKVEIRPNNRIGEPWVGAWQVFKEQFHE